MFLRSARGDTGGKNYKEVFIRKGKLINKNIQYTMIRTSDSKFFKAESAWRKESGQGRKIYEKENEMLERKAVVEKR